MYTPLVNHVRVTTHGFLSLHVNPVLIAKHSPDGEPCASVTHVVFTNLTYRWSCGETCEMSTTPQTHVFSFKTLTNYPSNINRILFFHGGENRLL